MSDGGVLDLDRIRNRFRPAYDVQGVLGRGGMAIVLRACQTSLHRLVALKVLDPALGAAPDFRERFYREARMASRLNHPGITTCYDFGQVDEYYYITFQLIEGHNLRTELERNGRLDQERAVEIFAAVATTLHYLHENGVVHRDVKPENVLIESHSGQAFVADLGVARDPEGVPLTNSENVLGTPAYVSPEQIAGEVPGPASDLYSLGVTLHEALTGRLPFDALTVAELIRRHLEEPPLFPAADFDRLHPEWPALLNRLLAKDPRARPGSCAQLATELEGLLGSAGSRTPSPAGSRTLLLPSTDRVKPAPGVLSGPPHAASSRKGSRSWLLLLGTALVPLAFSLFLLAGRRTAPPASPPSTAVPSSEPVPELRGPPGLRPYLEEFCATLTSHPAELRPISPPPPDASEQAREWHRAVLEGLHRDELGTYPGRLALLLVLDVDRVEGLEARVFSAPPGGEARTPGRPPVPGRPGSDGSLHFDLPAAWLTPGARLVAFPEGRLEVAVRRRESGFSCEEASARDKVPDPSPTYASDPVYHRAMDDQFTTDWRNALATLGELSQRFPEDAHLEATVAELAIAGTRSTPSKLEQQGLELVTSSRDRTDYSELLERGVRLIVPLISRYPRDPILWVHLGTALTMAGFLPEGELCWKLGCLRGPTSYWAWHEKLQNIEDLGDILRANRSDYARAYKLARDIHVLLPPGQLRYAQQHDHAVSELSRRAGTTVTSPRSGR